MICKTKSNQICIKDKGIALFWPPESRWITLYYFSNVSAGKKEKKTLISSEIPTMKYIHVSKVSMKNNGDLLLLAVKLKIY